MVDLTKSYLILVKMKVKYSIRRLNETVNFVCLCTQQKYIPVKMFGGVKVCDIVVHELYIVAK